MNIRKLLTGILINIMLISVSEIVSAQNSVFDEKEIGHVYHVSIPNYMTKSHNLNEAASLQYLNAAKETYVIVIEDSKEQLLEVGIPFNNPKEFYEYFEETFTDQNCDISKLEAIDINGHPAVQTEITKPFGEHNVCYLVTVIESDTHFYKMLAWTIEDRKNKYMEDFRKIASSFRE